MQGEGDKWRDGEQETSGDTWRERDEGEATHGEREKRRRVEIAGDRGDDCMEEEQETILGESKTSGEKEDKGGDKWRVRNE